MNTQLKNIDANKYYTQAKEKSEKSYKDSRNNSLIFNASPNNQNDNIGGNKSENKLSELNKFINDWDDQNSSNNQNYTNN